MLNIEISVIDVNNLMTAENAHKMATGWRNEELTKCLTTLMDKINDVASRGGLSGEFAVNVDRPLEFYDTLEKALITLGYEVKKPIEPNRGGYYKYWKISW